MTNPETPAREQATSRKGAWGGAIVGAWALLAAGGVLVALQGGLTFQPSLVPLPADAPPAGQIVTGRIIGMAVRWVEAACLLVPWWLGAAGWGYALRRKLYRAGQAPIAVQLAAGHAAMLLLGWLLAWAGLVHGAVGWSLCAVGMLLLARPAWRKRNRRLHLAAAGGAHPAMLLAAPACGLIAVACLCPPGTLWAVEAHGYDVLSYHLQLPREWLALGAMRGLQHNVYSYFPSLAEAGYLHLGAMRGSLYEAIYATQLFHASFALLGAGLLGRLVALRFGTAAGWCAAALLLALPWTVICACSAYNELMALAFSAAALLVLMQPSRPARGHCVLAGALLGAATLAKLTAGPMLVLPIWLVALLRPLRRGRGPALGPALLVAAGGLAVVSPYLVRNTLWARNPVFPFATRALGRAHWTAGQARAWHDVHAGGAPWHERPGRLWPQWLANPGYGAVLAGTVHAAPDVVEHFGREGRVPLLWAGALLGALGLLATRNGRGLAIAMLFVLAVQLLFWLGATKQPSRYLYFTVLPGCALASAGLHATAARIASGRTWPGTLAAAALCIGMTAAGFGVFHGQVRTVRVGDERVRLRPWQIVDALPTPAEARRMPSGAALVGDHPLNHLPASSRTCVVGEAAVLYMDGRFDYASAWDIGPLGGRLRAAGGGARAVTRALRDMGYTHLWVSWSELSRIHRTVGTHDGVDEHLLRAIAREAWHPLVDLGHATLFELPGVPE